MVSQHPWRAADASTRSAWHNGTMRFRTGLITGLGIGYVLGARAGRERYDQLMRAWYRARSNERVAGAIEVAGDLTEMPRAKARGVMGNGLRAAGAAIRERSEASDGRPAGQAPSR